MAKFVWALTCRRVIFDKATNSVSYIDALEALTATEFPVEGLPIIVTGLWRREGESESALEVRAYLQAPNGDELVRQGTVLKYEPGHRRGRVALGLTEYQVAAPGVYTVVVEHREGGRWVEDSRIPIDFDDGRPKSAEHNVSTRRDAVKTAKAAKGTPKRKLPVAAKRAAHRA